MKDLFTQTNLQFFFASYSKIVELMLERYGITEHLKGDHLGCLLHSTEEFEEVTKELLKISSQIKEVELHGRRVRVFKLNEYLRGIFIVEKIEIFEPKPEVGEKNSRYGVEHISFYIPNYDEFILKYRDNLKVAKEGEFGNSKFLKTEIINTIEVEFRSDQLGEENK